jgi:hypothetical protein
MSQPWAEDAWAKLTDEDREDIAVNYDAYLQQHPELAPYAGLVAEELARQEAAYDQATAAVAERIGPGFNARKYHSLVHTYGGDMELALHAYETEEASARQDALQGLGLTATEVTRLQERRERQASVPESEYRTDPRANLHRAIDEVASWRRSR